MPPVPQRLAFGARVRALRTDRGWSQEELAHRANLDRTYVSGVERGVRNPTLDVITRFADTLEVEVADLFPRGGVHSER
ncbi:MAG: helix-turn-helix transcriptional regulator [Propionicimonas sp.]|uniref:helix-turn-helix domain-containing protein n=1 Tax=Propionicimonas sp. TaxID=1955623 RepID=UPI002B1FCC87|nr:helix-turn-helix transcriptional regulator [Propionicimonas sp.]MEA4944581.1 helix-turn-helix transcriptional regulator [Propionicimonas sp.]MEA5054115.1 helix-turn-helix transcriptional regulator [Propionicimonas sp.]MEA5116262.1 helix-turn-helix transcriptional regulator [Propionicimonas sp.]